MPFCPKCGYEYRPEISFCPDCNERLISSLPGNTITGEPEVAVTPTDWIPLVRVDSQVTAEMVVDLLQSKEIPAVIMSGAGYSGIRGLTANLSLRSGGGAYTVMIPQNHIEDASGEVSIMLGDDWDKMKLI